MPDWRRTLQTEEKEGIISFDEVSALKPAVGDEATRSSAGASIVVAAIRQSHFRAHLPGIVPVILSAWRTQVNLITPVSSW